MDTDLLPLDVAPQLADDIYHYANDKFVQRAVQLKHEIATSITALGKEDRYIAKEIAKGTAVREISENINRTQSFVTKHAQNLHVKDVIVLMQHYELLLDGPMEFQRKNMLWRIAVDNEKKSPKSAIDALDKLNKMNKSYAMEGNTSQPINIVINNANLPRGVLDQ